MKPFTGPVPLVIEKQWEVLRYRFLRPGGVGIAQPTSGTSHTVTLPRAEPDGNYCVVATPTYNTTVWITNRTATSFQINLGTAASPGVAIFWQVFRVEA